MIPPQAIKDNASWTSNVVDLKGFDYAVVTVQLGATDIAMVALKVQEADAATDATTLTSGADVSGLIFGTSALPSEDGGATSALPSATDDNGVLKFYIDCKKVKRYINLVATAGDGTAGTYLSALCELSRAEQVPYNASTRGLTANLIK